MALDVGELRGRLKLDKTEFERGLTQAKTQFGNTGSDLASMAKKVGIAIGVALASGAVIEFGRELLNTSRSIVDMDRKARAVFEGQLPVIQKWAEENRKAFGLSAREVVGLAANFADLLKPMGFTAAQATEMSTRVLDLSGALAKWSAGKYTAAQVSEILTTALLGEREQLKSLGISITQAEVDARVLANGNKDLTGSALQQAEAIATQQLIFEKSTDAQKAWAEGGRAAAEAQGTLGSTIDTVKEKLATALTPAFEAATRKIGEWAETGVAKVSEFAGVVASTNDVELTNLRNALQGVSDQVGGALSASFEKAKKWVSDNKVEIQEFTDNVAEFTRDTGPVLVFLIETIANQWMFWGRAIIDTVNALDRLGKWYKDNLWWLSPLGLAAGNLLKPSAPTAPIPGGAGAPMRGLAEGGLVPATPGGRIARLAEGGEDEIVSPVSTMEAAVRSALAGGSLGTVEVIITDRAFMRGTRKRARIGGGRPEVVLVGGD